MQPHPLMLNSIRRTHTWPLNQPIFSFLFATHWMGWLAKLRPNWLLGKFQIDFMIWFFNQLWNDFAKKSVKNHFLVEVRNRNFVFFVAFKNGFRFHGQHWKTVFDVEEKIMTVLVFANCLLAYLLNKSYLFSVSFIFLFNLEEGCIIRKGTSGIRTPASSACNGLGLIHLKEQLIRKPGYYS